MAARHSTTADPEAPGQATEEDWGLPGQYQQLPQQPGPANRDPLSQQLPPLPGQDGAEPGSGSSESESPTSRPQVSPAMFGRKAKMYEALAKGVFRAVGGLLNKQLSLADDPDDKCWIPDDDDEAAVPPPLGRLAAKYAPLGDGQDLSDLENLGAAAVGLLAWGAKSAIAMWDARKRRRAALRPLRESGAVVYEDGEDAGQAM